MSLSQRVFSVTKNFVVNDILIDNGEKNITRKMESGMS